MRPLITLWRALLPGAPPPTEPPLDCDACFGVIESLAEAGVRGVHARTLRAAARRHLAHCPDCREHHLRRLHALEQGLHAPSAAAPTPCQRELEERR